MSYGEPSALCYIGAVMRLMDHRGDPIAQDELFALSGAGLCFPWKVDSNCDEISVIPEIPQRTFDALGYASEFCQEKDLYFDKIKASIDAGRPVIGFGLTAPDYACLITGYDNDGLYCRAYWAPKGEGKKNPDGYYYVSDWQDLCRGILVVGEKTGERLTGKAAYDRITEWALWFRRTDSKKVGKQEIPINRAAFPAMNAWLLDDNVWASDEQTRKNEVWLKQCGLLLLDYYRSNLYSYLSRLNAEHSDIVNQSALSELERMKEKFSAARGSDLHLTEIAGLENITDFTMLRDRKLRERLAAYVESLSHIDSSLQWTLFMPDFVKGNLAKAGLKLESFEYREFSAMRFIGLEGDDKLGEALRALDVMKEYASGFDHPVVLAHHNGFHADTKPQFVSGRFMKADAPVPEGFVAVEFVPHDNAKAGAPYYSRFAFAVFVGADEAANTTKGFDVNALYDITRNIVLGDGVLIPYPDKYWTAGVFLDNSGRKPEERRHGYLFSVGPRD